MALPPQRLAQDKRGFFFFSDPFAGPTSLLSNTARVPLPMKKTTFPFDHVAGFFFLFPMMIAPPPSFLVPRTSTLFSPCSRRSSRSSQSLSLSKRRYQISAGYKSVSLPRFFFPPTKRLPPSPSLRKAFFRLLKELPFFWVVIDSPS